MNIFAISDDPVLAAQYLCDKHVVKMPLETAQMLSTVWDKYLRTLADPAAHTPSHIYKATHENHPCVLWAGLSTGNYEWLVTHGQALVAEHQYRYPGSARHASYEVIKALRNPPPSVVPGPRSPFAQAVPDAYKREDPVIAYRLYYLNDKLGMAAWTNRQRPYWTEPLS